MAAGDKFPHLEEGLPEFPTTDQYSLFASCYDHIMRHIDYSAWAQAMDRLLQEYGGQVQRVLDLACGTGTLVLELAPRGYACTGMDLSPQMIKLARRKAARAGVAATFTQGDMRSFVPPRALDAVLCLHDSMNYMCSKKDVVAVLQSVSRALKPGGLFIFDVSTRRNILHNFSGKVFSEDNQEYAFIWRNGYNILTGIATVEIDFLLKGKAHPQWGRETHVQRIYSKHTLQHLIARCGCYRQLALFDGFSRRPVSWRSDEITFVLRKRDMPDA